MTRYVFYNMTLKELDALKVELPEEHADVHAKLKARSRWHLAPNAGLNKHAASRRQPAAVR